MNAIFNRFLII